MPKFTVYFMTPYQTYVGVEATDEDDAIKRCKTPAYFDANEPFIFLAVEDNDEKRN